MHGIKNKKSGTLTTYFSFFRPTRYATANNPAIANITSNPGTLGVGAGVSPDGGVGIVIDFSLALIDIVCCNWLNFDLSSSG